MILFRLLLILPPIFIDVCLISNLEKILLSNCMITSINEILPTSRSFEFFLRNYKSANTFPNKDRVPMSLASNVIYKFQCDRCSKCNIGDTRRHLWTRIREHVSGKPTPIEVKFKHIHPPRFDRSILYCHLHSRSFYQNCRKPSFNFQQSKWFERT